MKSMLSLFVLFLGFTFSVVAAPQAVLQSLKGKVQVKAPGSSTWVDAKEGQVLAPAMTISTGFDSTVVVVIDLNTIQVKPLTRMTLDKLIEESGTVKTTTFLRVGGVSASVKSAEGVKQDFKVQSPYSTASVRGTAFDYDGIKLKVRNGVVALFPGRPKRESQPAPVNVAVAEEGEGAGTESGSPSAPDAGAPASGNPEGAPGEVAPTDGPATGEAGGNVDSEGAGPAAAPGPETSGPNNNPEPSPAVSQQPGVTPPPAPQTPDPAPQPVLVSGGQTAVVRVTLPQVPRNQPAPPSDQSSGPEAAQAPQEPAPSPPPSVSAPAPSSPIGRPGGAPGTPGSGTEPPRPPVAPPPTKGGVTITITFDN